MAGRTPLKAPHKTRREQSNTTVQLWPKVHLFEQFKSLIVSGFQYPKPKERLLQLKKIDPERLG